MASMQTLKLKVVLQGAPGKREITSGNFTSDFCGDLTDRNGDLTSKNWDLTSKNCDLTNRNGDLTLAKMVINGI